MRILVLPNDGIGPEITEATVTVINALNARYGLGLQLFERLVGERALETVGTTVPEPLRRELLDAEGILFGPVSTHTYPKDNPEAINPSAFIRRHLELYANIRPARTREGVPAHARDTNMVIVRENSEGFYADRNMVLGSGEFMPTEDMALSVRKITRQGSERIAVVAFDLARRRRKKVTVVHKANVMKLTDGLFVETVRDVATQFSDVEVEELFVDAAAAHLVRRPHEFDVMVTTNLFGDVLSDLAAELVGSLGLGGSVNTGPSHVVAQAQHGSAPDIAGQGKANPIGLMVSAAMMLAELGARHGRDDLRAASTALEKAIDVALVDTGNRTPDLGGSATTAAVAVAVVDALAETPN